MQLETCIDQAKPNVDCNLDEFSFVSHRNEIDRCHQSPKEEPAHHLLAVLSFALAICSYSTVKASKFLFEFFIFKHVFIERQLKVASQWEEEQYQTENAGKRKIIIVAARLKFRLLKPQKYANGKAEIALNKERVEILPNELFLEFSIKPLA